MRLQIAHFPVNQPRDLRRAGQRARRLGSLAGLAARRRTAFGRAVESALGPLWGSGTALEITFGCSLHDGRQGLEAVIRVQTGGREASGPATRAIVPDPPGPSVVPDPSVVPEGPIDSGPSAGAPQPPSLQQARALVDSLSVERRGTSLAIALWMALSDRAEPIGAETARAWGALVGLSSTHAALAACQRRLDRAARDLRTARRREQSLRGELDNVKHLNETLELLALVASKTENAVVILDGQSRLEWVNDGFARMTGYELAEVQGRPIREVFYGPDEGSEAAAEMEAALSAGRRISQDILHHRKDGRTFWASISVTPVWNDAGDVHRWIGIASDATRRRHVQEALQQAKEEAEAASRAKSEFLANMSHEIRTPMNAIIGMTELALGTTLGQDQREYLTTVLESAESLLRLLNDVLDLSKIEAGKLPIESIEFPVLDTLRDTLKAFSFQASQKGLRLELKLPEHVPERLVGDPARLRQVLTNLVGNAIKFTDRGEVTVAVECTHRDDCSAELHFTVSDTGIGIAREHLGIIFEAFTQTDSSMSRRFGGTGLGLAISAQLIELMDGRIRVESEEGVGSCFHFCVRFALPPARCDSPADPEPPTAPAPAEKIESVARLPRVLIADDNRANRHLVSKILQGRTAQLTEAESGEQVLELVRQQPFDIVLLDVQMPGMDGLETAAAIRQMDSPSHRRPHLIAMTAHALRSDRQRCIAAGMDAYIAKPLRARKLLDLIESVAASRRDQRADQPRTATPRPDDFAAALKRLEGDHRLLLDQMRFFLEDSPILVRDIVAALDADDAKKLQMSAHRLRGLAAGFDWRDLIDAARRLEEIGRSGKTLKARKLQKTLVTAWEQLRQALERYLQAQ